MLKFFFFGKRTTSSSSPVDTQNIALTSPPPREDTFDGSIFVELGALSAEPFSNNLIRCVLDTTEILPDVFCELASELGFSFIHSEEVPDTNWSTLCPELLAETQIGRFHIHPLAEMPQSPPEQVDPNRIFLIPGSGFGTGHHVSTAMIGQMMQSPALLSLAPTQVLDIGAGSGILSIFAARLFPCQVLAVDNDSLALENARQNVNLNGCDESITLILSTADRLPESKFDLVLANLYAEVLINLSLRLRSQVRPGGMLLVSGIVDSYWAEVSRSFDSGWTLLDLQSSHGWSAAAFRRM